MTPTQHGDAPEGQRRQVTVLFADMADYTPLAEKLGEEDTYLLMQQVIRALSEAVHAHEGTVQEMTGDGVMALFGAPIALEEAPVHACRAALEMQTRMAALAEHTAAKHGVRPQLRVGIHSGPLVVGQVGDDQRMQMTALGDTVNLASRLETAATPGAVLMSEATHALVDGYVESSFAGERELKGKSEPQKLWLLEAMKAGAHRFDVSRGRGLTALIGRRRELETMETLWADAAAGAIQAVDLIGEAGIGKSRLVHEFRGRLDDERTFMLEGHCSAEGRQTPLLPFIDVVRTSFGIPDQAGREEVERRFRRGLELLGLDTGSLLPYVMNLLGHAPEDARIDEIAGEVLGIRTRDAILTLLRERCRLTPTVLFIDDLHWIDTASEQLLSRIVALEQELPLLVLSTYRPEFNAPWAGRANVTELRLSPLSTGSTVDLLQHLLGTDDLPEELTRLVSDKAEGNPLFAEEIVRYLQGQGSLRQVDGGVFYEAVDGASALPITLENLLLDRFDRLEPGPRATLEVAAVIGAQFATDFAAAASGMAEATAGYLDELERHDLIHREAAGGAFRFKHALVRDAIYDSLLSARRAALHEQVAEALEARGDSGEAADQLAHHWSHTDRADKAVAWLAIAGENSLRVYSLEEAQQLFQQALTLLQDKPNAGDDAALADILLHLARIMYFQVNFRGIIELVNRYLPRVEALGDKRRLSRFLFEGGYARVFAAEIGPGEELLKRARALGEELGDELAVGYAELGLMWLRCFWGEPGEERRRAQREIGERVADIGIRHRDIWLASKARLCLGLDEAGWGRPGDAHRDFLRLMALSRETNDPRPQSMALWAMAILNLLAEDYEAAVESADEALRVCLSPIDRMSAEAYKTCAMMLMGTLSDTDREAWLHGFPAVEAGGLVMTLAFPAMITGVDMVLRGEMAAGVRTIDDTERRFSALEQTLIHISADSFLGEIYLRMATGKEKPPISVMRKNWLFLLRTLPVAARKARRHFESLTAQARAFDTPFNLASGLYGLARLDIAKKRHDDARTRLEEARAVAQSVEATALVDKIEASLATLAAPAAAPATSTGS